MTHTLFPRIGTLPVFLALLLVGCGGGTGGGEISRINPPSDLVAEAVSSTEVTLTWKDNSGVETGYQIERKLSGSNDSFAEIATVEKNVMELEDTGLKYNTLYSYRVRALNDEAFSDYSSAEVKTINVIPAAPSNLTATTLSTTEIRLEWQDNADNETEVVVSIWPEGSLTVSITRLPGADQTSYVVSRLTTGTTYHFQVRASNEIGDSPLSNTASAGTSSLPPP